MSIIECLVAHKNAGTIYRFAENRAAGMTVPMAGDAAEVSLPTAYRYEHWLEALARDLHISVDGVPLSTVGLVRIRETIAGRVAPSGCRWCGLEEREHAQRWTETAGWHGWTEPTEVQRMTRMRARRAARETTENEATPSPARPEVAPQQAHTNPTEGVTAP